MAVNLLGLVKDQLSTDVVSKLAGFLGENTANTQSALTAALPSVLAGLMQKGSTDHGAETLLNLLKQGNFSGGILENLGSLVSGGTATTSAVTSGSMLLNTLFGSKLGGIVNLVSSTSGINKSSSTSLLSLAAPIVMGALGRETAKQGITSGPGLAGLLEGQSSFLKGMIPAGLSGILGMSGLSALENAALPVTPAAAQSGQDGLKMAIPLIVLVLAAILIWWLLRGCNAEPPQPMKAVPGAAVVDSAVSKAGNMISALGKFFARKLPTGVELNIPENGIENKLIAFIEDQNRPVDKTTWFTFDRLTFETGKATLKPESGEQLHNIAEIMKAYPKVELKIGGYTDNTGSAAGNVALSQARADNVMNEIVKLGVPPARLKAEGYGQEHPVADNATEEGRAQNRRIDVRVIRK